MSRGGLLRRRSGVTDGTIPPPGGGDGTIETLGYAVYGDSMAGGSGAPQAADKWFNVLADLIETQTGTRPPVFTYGVGGTRLGTHAQLQMGKPMTVTVAGGQIPTSGAVVITPAEAEFDLGESPTGTAAFPNFTLAGIAGTVRRPGGRNSDPITFTRNVSGSATPAGGQQTLTHTPGVTHRAKGVLYFGPHNNRAESMILPRDNAYKLGQPYIQNTIDAMLTYNTSPYRAVLGLSSGPTVTERVGGKAGAGQRWVAKKIFDHMTAYGWY